MKKIVEKVNVVCSQQGQEIGSNFAEDGSVNTLYYKENKNGFFISLLKKIDTVYTQDDTEIKTAATFEIDNGFASAEILFNDNGQEVSRECYIYAQEEPKEGEDKPVVLTVNNVEGILGIKHIISFGEAEEITKSEINLRAPGTMRNKKLKSACA